MDRACPERRLSGTLTTSAAGCDGCSAGDAPEGAAGRHPAVNAARFVTSQGSTVSIQPAAPDVVYVPAYNPLLVYGIPSHRGRDVPLSGIWYGGPYLSFGIGFGIGFLWFWMELALLGFDWHNRTQSLTTTGLLASTTFYNRNYITPEEAHATICRRPSPGAGLPPEALAGAAGFTTVPAERPGLSRETYRLHENAEPRGQSETHSGFFSGYGQGGQPRSYSSRGSRSIGGGATRGGGVSRGGGDGAPHGGGAAAASVIEVS